MKKVILVLTNSIGLKHRLVQFFQKKESKLGIKLIYDKEIRTELGFKRCLSSEYDCYLFINCKFKNIDYLSLFSVFNKCITIFIYKKENGSGSERKKVYLIKMAQALEKNGFSFNYLIANNNLNSILIKLFRSR